MNPLTDDLDEAPEPGADLVLWAGWLDESGDPASGRFEADHRLWNAGADLAEKLRALVLTLERKDARVLLRPALGCALSDPHSASACLEAVGSERVGLFVDPVAMLTPEMHAHADDHLPRMLDKAGKLSGAWGCVLSGASVSEGRVRHEPIDWDRPFDRALRSAWRESELAGRDIWIICEACLERIA